MARIARKETALFDWLPDIEGIGCSLKLLEGRYVEFSYATQLKASHSPSAVAARANTVYAAENPDTVKGFLVEGSIFYAKTTGHICVRLRSICRRFADSGEYQFRTFRIVGIRAESLKCLDGRNGKRPVFACGVGVAEVR